MPDPVTAERVAAMAAAARVPLRPEAPARIAGAVTPTVMRFAAEKVALDLEIEPSTFTVVALKEAGR